MTPNNIFHFDKTELSKCKRGHAELLEQDNVSRAISERYSHHSDFIHEFSKKNRSKNVVGFAAIAKARVSENMDAQIAIFITVHEGEEISLIEIYAPADEAGDAFTKSYIEKTRIAAGGKAR